MFSIGRHQHPMYHAPCPLLKKDINVKLEGLSEKQIKLKRAFHGLTNSQPVFMSQTVTDKIWEKHLTCHPFLLFLPKTYACSLAICSTSAVNGKSKVPGEVLREVSPTQKEANPLFGGFGCNCYNQIINPGEKNAVHGTRAGIHSQEEGKWRTRLV